jgi:hypothetical protein
MHKHAEGVCRRPPPHDPVPHLGGPNKMHSFVRGASWQVGMAAHPARHTGPQCRLLLCVSRPGAPTCWGSHTTGAQAPAESSTHCSACATGHTHTHRPASAVNTHQGHTRRVGPPQPPQRQPHAAAMWCRCITWPDPARQAGAFAPRTASCSCCCRCCCTLMQNLTPRRAVYNPCCCNSNCCGSSSTVAVQGRWLLVLLVVL